ncbi:uncharacterized protein LOC123557293 isoform X1 [Mercenaria mercenaria]|uniref:uncharacterized protein LOC123557293 isoform X1 n=1 Tax=Mercenaria mercenaria TaxID=6596 RepID=UPI00234E5601|nr:uncharacterized protein LOC123557293 isoform X1 [Mercenaria mercenaria]
MYINAFRVCAFWICIISMLHLELAEEPVCTSRFDYDLKIVEKFYEMDQKIKRAEEEIRRQRQLIDRFSTDGEGVVQCMLDGAETYVQNMQRLYTTATSLERNTMTKVVGVIPCVFPLIQFGLTIVMGMTETGDSFTGQNLTRRVSIYLVTRFFNKTSHVSSAKPKSQHLSWSRQGPNAILVGKRNTVDISCRLIVLTPDLITISVWTVIQSSYLAVAIMIMNIFYISWKLDVVHYLVRLTLKEESFPVLSVLPNYNIM